MYNRVIECFYVRLKVGNTYPCNTSTVQVQYTRGDTGCTDNKRGNTQDKKVNSN